jgi:tungstate transport system substrate-binding protein
MYNDFVLIAPESDAAGVKGKDIVAVLQTIKAKPAPFISRGDRSGTNMAEIKLWKDAGIDIAKDKGSWYKESGHGMGATLNTASALDAYVCCRIAELGWRSKTILVTSPSWSRATSAYSTNTA